MKTIPAMIGLLLLTTAGCQSPSKPAAPLPPTDPHVVFTNVPVKDTSPLNSFDPCAERVEDLIGPLLQYYRDKNHGPANIDELKPYGFAGEPLNLTCPVSHKSYLCAANGLHAPGEKIRIYIYDAEPSHNDERWCAVSDGAITGAPGFSTVHVPEARFKNFLATATPGASPAQDAPAGNK